MIRLWVNGNGCKGLDKADPGWGGLSE